MVNLIRLSIVLFMLTLISVSCISENRRKNDAARVENVEKALAELGLKTVAEELKTELGTLLNCTPENEKLVLGVELNLLTRSNPNCSLFLTFAQDKNKKYKSSLKAVAAFTKFNLNSQKLDQLNLQPGKKFKVKLNKFSDRKLEDVIAERSRLTIPDFETILPAGKLKKKEDNLKLKKSKSFLEVSTERKRRQVTWEPIDWVAKGVVSPADNQHACGACWAFAAGGMLESYKAIKSNSPVQTISRQYLLDCITPLTQSPGSCQGGHHIYAAMWAQLAPFATEATYPYKLTQDSTGVCPAAIDKPLNGFFTDYNVHQEVTEQMYEFLKKGPVAVNMDSAAQEFVSYGSGVVSYQCTSAAPNHAVLLVGYGKEADGTEYWKIKNSWGADWGEAGYAKLAKDTCFILTNVVELI